MTGRSYHFDLGDLKARFTFDSSVQGSFVVAGLALDGYGETVVLNLHEICEDVDLNSWAEARRLDPGAGRTQRPARPRSRRERSASAVEGPAGGLVSPCASRCRCADHRDRRSQRASVCGVLPPPRPDNG
ncbi:hypothetical protein [Actinoplanes sp. M2I2]|uniref:MoaF-related domain-containing protein n=1 Tax=Actinoplanes sp. M2I2 TaxID=1734444 RepID=UPI0035AFD970